MEVQEALDNLAKFKIAETGGEIDYKTGQPQRIDDILLMDIFAGELNVLQGFINKYNPTQAIPFIFWGGIADGRCPKCNRLLGLRLDYKAPTIHCWYCNHEVKIDNILVAFKERTK